MTTRAWTRDRESEGFPEWASRVYRSDDGWIATRVYIAGDRGLVRPAVGWEITHERVSGWGFGGSAHTLVEAKAWPDTAEGRAFFSHAEEPS